jgi:hypothetical protein
LRYYSSDGSVAQHPLLSNQDNYAGIESGLTWVSTSLVYLIVPSDGMSKSNELNVEL